MNRSYNFNISNILNMNKTYNFNSNSSLNMKKTFSLNIDSHFSQLVTSCATASFFAHKLSRVSCASCKLLQYSPYLRNRSLYSTKISPIRLALGLPETDSKMLRQKAAWTSPRSLMFMKMIFFSVSLIDTIGLKQDKK